MTLTSRTAATFSPPVMEARRWLDGVQFTPETPLLNVSQAAPLDPPPQALRAHIAEVALHDDTAHLYGAVLGDDALRQEIASQWSAAYGGVIVPEQVGITAGCNQAFAATIASLAGEGDEVILPTPWYFNHKMWLDMQGVTAVALSVGDGMLPSVERAAALITERTRAIVLVSPNNPTGVEYPPELLRGFYELAQAHGIRLIVDETYRDFDSRAGAPHDLFGDDDWSDALVHLYSFSKAYRLTGHRVGAIVGGVGFMAEVEKFLDTVAICPNRLGQRAALWGMQNLGDWLAKERLDILDRRAAITDNLHKLTDKGWRLLGLGAYFAYFEHPFEMASDELACDLVKQARVLVLPGTMFMPDADQDGKKQLRIAFANVTRPEIGALFDRLAAYQPA